MKRSQLFPSVALLLAACSGNAVDLGDGPLTAPPVSPAPGEVSIQCEDGIDCHDGVCASCFLETCFCDSSAALTASSCIAAGATATAPVVSDDGSAIAFAACLQDGRCRSYHWTAASGRQVIPAAGSDNTHPTGISGDGQLVLLSPSPIFGYGQVIDTPDGNRRSIPAPLIDPSTLGVWVYRVGAGVQATGLPAWLPGFGSEQRAVKLSAGGIVVGLTWAENGSQQLMRWTEARGLEPLASFPVLPDPPPSYGWRSVLRINDVTPDASAIVGMRGEQALLWTQEGGVQSDLGPVPILNSTFMGISRDGTTLVGALYDGAQGVPSAFRWRRNESSLTELGPFDQSNGTFSADRTPNLFVSDDGSIVGGLLDGGKKGNGPFRWTEQSGLEALVQHAAFTYPNPFLSGDGRIIGDGPNQQFYYSYSRPYSSDPEPPHRFESGPISALSHDGRFTVGIGRCGGVAALYRETLAWEE